MARATSQIQESQAVCLFGGTSFAFGADFEDVSSDSLVSALLRGAAGGGISRAPFGPSSWGCLRRVACYVAQHPPLLEQIMWMS